MLDFEATVDNDESGFAGSLGPNVPLWCTMPVHTVSIDFDAHGGDPFTETRRPATLGACRCPPASGTSIDLNCRENYCPAGQTYVLTGKVYDFTWDPITGCSHMGEDELAYKFHNMYQNDPEFF